MGIFGNIANAAKAVTNTVTEGVAMAKAQQDAAEAARAAAPVTILNPTPQEQIDAGAQRGVLTSISYTLEEGGHALSMAVWVRVRPRLAAGELGQEVRLKMRTSSRVAQQLRPGREVPVTIVAGAVTSVDAKALAKEL